MRRGGFIYSVDMPGIEPGAYGLAIPPPHQAKPLGIGVVARKFAVEIRRDDFGELINPCFSMVYRVAEGVEFAEGDPEIHSWQEMWT